MLQPYIHDHKFWNFFLKLTIHKESNFLSLEKEALLEGVKLDSLPLHSHSHKDTKQGISKVLLLAEGIKEATDFAMSKGTKF